MRKNGFDGGSFRDIADAPSALKPRRSTITSQTRTIWGITVMNGHAGTVYVVAGVLDDPAETPRTVWCFGQMGIFMPSGLKHPRWALSSIICLMKHRTEVQGVYYGQSTWVDTVLTGSQSSLSLNLVIGMMHDADGSGPVNSVYQAVSSRSGRIFWHYSLGGLIGKPWLGW